MRPMMRHRIGGLGSVFEMSWAEITHLYEDLVSWFIPRAGVETYCWWQVPRQEKAAHRWPQILSMNFENIRFRVYRVIAVIR